MSASHIAGRDTGRITHVGGPTSGTTEGDLMTESNTTDVDVVIVGAGLRRHVRAGQDAAGRLQRGGARDRRRRRRHLVLEPVPGRTLRHPLGRLLLQLGPRPAAGVAVVRALRRTTGDPPLRAVRRRQARPASRHPVQHPGDVRRVERRDQPLDDPHRQRRRPHVPAKFYVMATGCLSMPKVPDIEGTERFAGEVYFTSTWPHDGVDFTGKRVAVIGTGSSAHAVDSADRVAGRPAHRVPAHAELLDPCPQRSDLRRADGRVPQGPGGVPRRKPRHSADGVPERRRRRWCAPGVGRGTHRRATKRCGRR